MWIKFIKGKMQLVQLALLIRSQYSKSLLSQLYEIVRLRIGPGKLAATEYYDYRLYDDSQFDMTAKMEYGGIRLMNYIPQRLNNPEWVANSQDKLYFYAVLKQFSIPHPELQTICWYKHRQHGDTKVLTTDQQLSDFFSNQAKYPLFCKPTRGNYGTEALGIESYQASQEQFSLSNGDTINKDQLFQRLIRRGGFGYILQDKLDPHAALKKICGNRLSSVRINILTGPEGPEIYRAVWKIPIGNNMIDNFSAGTTGNLVAKICVTSGQIEQVISGLGLNRKQVYQHPDTDAPFDDLILPNWEKLVELVKEVSTIFVGLRWQGWDIALTDKGPLILEMNHISGIGIIQNSYGEGVYSPELKKLCGQEKGFH